MDGLPPEFLQHLEKLEEAYLRESDPIRQSGFNGGAQRWLAERSPILIPVTSDGSFLDVGCANGYLLECLVRWASDTGVTLTPFGVDYSARLVALARERLPRFSDHFHIANAWGWTPPRRFQYVYSVFDCVPQALLGDYVRHLKTHVVAPRGRLILGAYGSRSRNELPARIDELLEALRYTVAGCAVAGIPETARFAWIDV